MHRNEWTWHMSAVYERWVSNRGHQERMGSTEAI
jgi:hypothetical protein